MASHSAAADLLTRWDLRREVPRWNASTFSFPGKPFLSVANDLQELPTAIPGRSSNLWGIDFKRQVLKTR